SKDPASLDPRNPLAPFATSRGLRPGKVVTAGAGMGIDDAKGGRLEPQIREHTPEHSVFVNVGEVAGMKNVAVGHGSTPRHGASVVPRRELLAIDKVLATGFVNW